MANHAHTDQTVRRSGAVPPPAPEYCLGLSASVVAPKLAANDQAELWRRINWAPSLKAAFERAKRERKLVYVSTYVHPLPSSPFI